MTTPNPEPAPIDTRFCNCDWSGCAGADHRAYCAALPAAASATTADDSSDEFVVDAGPISAETLRGMATLMATRNRDFHVELEDDDTPGCGCDNDPIECGHEAARGDAEEKLRQAEAVLAARDAKLRKLADAWRAAGHVGFANGLYILLGLAPGWWAEP